MAHVFPGENEIDTGKTSTLMCPRRRVTSLRWVVKLFIHGETKHNEKAKNYKWFK